MKGRSGFTLIETIISITLFAFILVSFMQGLNSSMLGTHRARMNNAATHVARSQMEFIHQQDYIVHSQYGAPMEWNETLQDWLYLPSGTGSYKKVMDLPGGFSYEDISITVSLVDAPGSAYECSPEENPELCDLYMGHAAAMQRIDINVSYERDSQGRARTISLTGYKAPRLATVVRAAGRYPVSKELTEIADLFGISSGGAQGVPNDIGACCNSGRCGSAAECAEEGLTPPCHPERQCRSYSSPSGGEGYYYVFRTGTTGPICASWIYKDTGSSDHIDCLEGTCDDGIGLNYAYVWLYQGIPAVFGDEGQGQGLVELSGGETYPRDICNSDPDCTYLTHVKTHESGGGERYLASIGTSGDEWPPGIYTVFFHNWGYYDIGCETTSASVAYYW